MKNTKENDKKEAYHDTSLSRGDSRPDLPAGVFQSCEVKAAKAVF